jgi:hypothetical protein
VICVAGFVASSIFLENQRKRIAVVKTKLVIMIRIMNRESLQAEEGILSSLLINALIPQTAI